MPPVGSPEYIYQGIRNLDEHMLITSRLMKLIYEILSRPLQHSQSCPSKACRYTKKNLTTIDRQCGYEVPVFLWKIIATKTFPEFLARDNIEPTEISQRPMQMPNPESPRSGPQSGSPRIWKLAYTNIETPIEEAAIPPPPPKGTIETFQHSVTGWR
ncbi:hypothetical protein L211DRAFT_337857 [Terfezia boudieri ATCC MYA-4762]|uniref:Uncharacterized protein n=1 Tax=Terfezia boudieri ATCC MYA-4762 TaxID=1051890 RepID=A0A3N4LI48_9PEZI|nr:hypothetical protein L211DRAFT_337857 [Terfezia boudieri ATCC MYA-4762]